VLLQTVFAPQAVVEVHSLTSADLVQNKDRSMLMQKVALLTTYSNSKLASALGSNADTEGDY
jgi:hypothetical protein